jgi:hypothetical protein
MMRLSVRHSGCAGAEQWSFPKTRYPLLPCYILLALHMDPFLNLANFAL